MKSKPEQYNRLEIGSLTLVSSTDKMRELVEVADKILKAHGDKVGEKKEFPFPPPDMFG